MPPAEAEAAFHETLEKPPIVAVHGNETRVCIRRPSPWRSAQPAPGPV
jgi:hypothetical protein